MGIEDWLTGIADWSSEIEVVDGTVARVMCASNERKEDFEEGGEGGGWDVIVERCLAVSREGTSHNDKPIVDIKHGL